MIAKIAEKDNSREDTLWFSCPAWTHKAIHNKQQALWMTDYSKTVCYCSQRASRQIKRVGFMIWQWFYFIYSSFDPISSSPHAKNFSASSLCNFMSHGIWWRCRFKVMWLEIKSMGMWYLSLEDENHWALIVQCLVASEGNLTPHQCTVNVNINGISCIAGRATEKRLYIARKWEEEPHSWSKWPNAPDCHSLPVAFSRNQACVIDVWSSES